MMDVQTLMTEGQKIGLEQALDLVKIYIKYGKDPVEELSKFIEEHTL